MCCLLALFVLLMFLECKKNSKPIHVSNRLSQEFTRFFRQLVSFFQCYLYLLEGHKIILWALEILFGFLRSKQTSRMFPRIFGTFRILFVIHFNSRKLQNQYLNHEKYILDVSKILGNIRKVYYLDMRNMNKISRAYKKILEPSNKYLIAVGERE